MGSPLFEFLEKTREPQKDIMKQKNRGTISKGDY